MCMLGYLAVSFHSISPFWAMSSPISQNKSWALCSSSSSSSPNRNWICWDGGGATIETTNQISNSFRLLSTYARKEAGQEKSTCIYKCFRLQLASDKLDDSQCKLTFFS